MANLTTQYGTVTSITATGLSTLANTSTVVSSTVDNTTNLFLDALLEVVVTHSSAPSAAGYVEIYVKTSIDNSDFDDDNNHKWVGTLAIGSTATGTRKRIVSIAAALGGSMPSYWQVFIRNSSGAAFSAGTLSYRGITAQTL